MTATELSQSASIDQEPPTGLSETARTLWFARAGRWDEAHDLCQNLPDPDGAWIHAWLHREEGDLGNAAYWYGRARKPTPSRGTDLADEWQEIAETLL
jgi:hypothetical protein